VNGVWVSERGSCAAGRMKSLDTNGNPERDVQSQTGVYVKKKNRKKGRRNAALRPALGPPRGELEGNNGQRAHKPKKNRVTTDIPPNHGMGGVPNEESGPV